MPALCTVQYRACPVWIALLLCAASTALAGTSDITLQTALIAEDVRDHQPVRPAVVMPVSVGKVVCFTSFGSVREQTTVYHAWYFRDRLITKRKFMVEPPRWSTYSAIQLRENDKGPWRVDILDQNNRCLTTLRFSITD